MQVLEHRVVRPFPLRGPAVDLRDHPVLYPHPVGRQVRLLAAAHPHPLGGQLAQVEHELLDFLFVRVEPALGRARLHVGRLGIDRHLGQHLIRPC